MGTPGCMAALGPTHGRSPRREVYLLSVLCRIELGLQVDCHCDQPQRIVASGRSGLGVGVSSCMFSCMSNVKPLAARAHPSRYLDTKDPRCIVECGRLAAVGKWTSTADG